MDYIDALIDEIRLTPKTDYKDPILQERVRQSAGDALAEMLATWEIGDIIDLYGRMYLAREIKQRCGLPKNSRMSCEITDASSGVSIRGVKDFAPRVRLWCKYGWGQEFTMYI